jgi:hypothetical protein
MTGTFGLYRASEMDAWLEKKVKPELDKLEAIKTHFENFPVSIRSVNQWINQGRKILEAEDLQSIGETQ